MAFLKRFFSRQKDLRCGELALTLNMEDILPDFSEKMKRNVQFIHSLALLPQKKVAFHGADADGIVSALILKSITIFSDAVFIPLDYQELRHQEYGDFLSGLNWIAIVDLPPFNKSELVLYVDHHLTNKAMVKNAKIVLYNENGLSAADLLAQYYHEHLPEEYNLLAHLTTITDTAGYSIDPPVDLSIDFPKNQDEQAWLLNDLCKTPESTVEVLSLLQDLFEQGLNIFHNRLYREKISKLRNLRKKTIKRSERFEPADVVIIIRGKEKLLTSALIDNLFKRGVKISCLMFPGKKFTGLSFRVSLSISESELDHFRVDHLATYFSGGGHPRAAGGRGHSLKETMNEIIIWIKERKLSYNIYDLRELNE